MKHRRFPRKMKIFSFAIILFFLTGSVIVVGFRSPDSDYFFKINKSIDIFGRVYREVAMNYVDEVDPERFMESGIDGMLSSLDPYTNFIGEQEGDEVELMTVGKYGGIGITIGQRDGYITVISLMEGYSAQRQGLLPGDRILLIDGKPLSGMRPDRVRSLTRGEPGTSVHLEIGREGAAKPLEFDLVREEIQLKNITYADFIEDGIAYVKLERFSRNAGDELRVALRDLGLRQPVRGVILDLRDNPGGLLDVAVDVVEKFAAKGSLVVSTKGRRPDMEKKYYVTEEPMLPDVPLAVVVNHGSASASEIVAGAIQDLDRGIILGTRTFGKGLVQTITPLVYNTQLKITTAKYYTPSGRCIQEIDYGHRTKDGEFSTVPDSLRRTFKTLRGRKELEAGGITPDTVVADPEHGSLYTELVRKAMFFKFATKFAAQHAAMPDPLADESLLREFNDFLKHENFAYEDAGELKLRELSELADKSKYSPSVREAIRQLQVQLAKGKDAGVTPDNRDILQELKAEITSRYKGEKGRIATLLAADTQVRAAMVLLRNQKSYGEKLGLR